MKGKLFFVLCCLSALCFLPNISAQTTRTVSGVVFDELGEGMPGVFVYDKSDKKKGAMTDVNGKFQISIKSNCKELTFEMMGYKTLELPLDKITEVQLQPDNETLDEVVVTGIYTRKAESFTGAVQSVTQDELKRVSSGDVFKSLQTLDPSLMIFDNLSSGSDPNAMASMQLRGASSFADESSDLKNPNLPLFILDGFETTLEKVKDLDMNRIESVTILKDASAKAIYGSKAGNGVIVIETKSLRGNKTAISYNGSLEVQMPDLSSYNLCNALEKLEVERRENYYLDMASSSDEIADALNLYNTRLKRAMEGESTYWLSKPLRTAFKNKHTLEVELGSKDLKNMMHFSFNDDPGVMKGSFRQTVGGDITTSYRRGKWQFRNIMEFTKMSSEDSPYGKFAEYAVMNPYYNPYDKDGNVVRYFESAVGRSNILVRNPLYNATINTKLSEEYIEFSEKLNAEFQVIPALKLVARFSVSSRRGSRDEFYPADHTMFANVIYSDNEMLRRGSYEMETSKDFTLSGDVSAQFNKKINDTHDIFATAQYNIDQTTSSNVVHYAEGFPNSRMNNITFARQYAEGKTPTGSDGIKRNVGFLLTGGYSYLDRYLLDATVKASASSVFGTNNRWGTFWSVGVAWNIRKETFLSGARWLKQLKLRASAGTSGNQNNAALMSIPVYRYYNNAYYDGFTGAYPYNMGNPDLGWESKLDWNAGVDFRTERVSLIANVYLCDTRNLVFQRSLLPSAGFTYSMDNLGKVRNKGVELSINYRFWQRGGSYLSVFGSIASNNNRILEISDVLRNYNKQQQELAEESENTTPVIQYYDGCPMNSIWVVPSKGIDPVTGKEIFVDRNGNLTNKWNAADLVNFGSSDPLFNGSCGLNGEVEGFGINCAFTFYGGGYQYNTTLVNKVENVSVSENLDRRIFTGRWFEPGQSAQYRNGQNDKTNATSRFVQKNNVFKISSVSLYYEFPYKLMAKAKMQRLRISLYANDVYTFSSIFEERGTDYPFARSFTTAISLTF